MKLWLDDLRPVPYGYEGAKSVNEAKKLIQEAEHNGIEIEALDLDHDLGDYADILAEIGQQKEAFVFYIMAAVVSVEDQQDATFFDSLDRYFAGEWKLLYKTFETVLHQSVTKEQIDHLSGVQNELQYDEMKDFWNSSKAADFRRELTWFVDTYCHGEIEFKREE